MGLGLIEVFPDALLVVDEAGLIRAMNEAAAELFGYRREELIGRPLDGLLPPEAVAAHGARIADYFRAPRRGPMGKARTLDALRSTGERVPVEISLSLVQLEGRRMIAASVRDVTEHRRIAREAQQREERTRSLMRLTQVGTWELDLVTGQCAFSSELAAVAGFACTALPLTGLEEVIHPEDRGPLHEAVGRTRGGAGALELSVRVRRADGAWRWLDLRGFVELGPAGEPARIRGLAADATEQRLAQEQLVVTDRLASLGVLAAGLAHELNNPLAALLPNLEMLLDDLRRVQRGEPVDLAFVAQGAADALEAARRMSEITRDLMRLARGHGARAPVDLVKVLQASLRLGGALLRGRARVETDFQPVPPVLGTEAELGQVFLSLIINAAEAMPEGGALEHRLTVRTGLDGSGRVRGEVLDTGNGMAADVTARLFVPFFTTKTAGAGTGLSLAISHRIVTQHGGEIQVESIVGRGSTFRVLLPPA
ncbi:MAG: PAS domain S-box protein [Archangiaceae bacterium]|nr:PAS domain S-box protein [Archangiaceae bacterium]